MNDYGMSSALDLQSWRRKGRKVKVAGHRLLPRPAASMIKEEMNASLNGAC